MSRSTPPEPLRISGHNPGSTFLPVARLRTSMCTRSRETVRSFLFERSPSTLIREAAPSSTERAIGLYLSSLQPGPSAPDLCSQIYVPSPAAFANYSTLQIGTDRRRP